MIDPELLDGLGTVLTAHLPGGPLDVATVRALDERLRVDVPPAVAPRVVRVDGLALRLHGPVLTGDAACLLWIHGGGMFLGSAAADDAFCCDLAAALGVAVVAVDYRLAPEHPHPAPLRDCATALRWCAARSPRVVVVGGSAGGGLAAALCLLARDGDGPAIAAAHLYYPMLDDRTASTQDTPVWNQRLADLAWASYLDGRPADALAAPARAADLSGLPPSYVEVGDVDLFRDEDITYAQRLAAAGVAVRLVVVPGAVHAFEAIAPGAAVSREARERRLHALAQDLQRW